jgi:hypothetical protein
MFFFPGEFSALGNQKQIQHQLYKGTRFQGEKVMKWLYFDTEFQQVATKHSRILQTWLKFVE